MTTKRDIKAMLKEELKRRGIDAEIVEVGETHEHEHGHAPECPKTESEPKDKVEETLDWFVGLIRHQKGKVDVPTFMKLCAVYKLAVDGANAHRAMDAVKGVIQQFEELD